MSRNNNLDEALYSLPFDQFSRQFYVSEIIGLLRGKEKELSILDIGGYKGKTKEFQSKDKVTIADLFDATEDDYVKVEPDKLPFDDKQFDVTVSFDTFEHVPRDNRRNFLNEALRVSKSFHIMAAPIDNESRDVNYAEITANNSYMHMKGEEHRWLKEHIDYLIPTKDEAEQTFEAMGIYHMSVQTNEIALWLRMQQFFFCAELNSQCFSQVKKINTHYNKNLREMEANIDQKVAYRRIYCLTKDKRLYESFKSSFESFKNDIYSDENRQQHIKKVLELDQLIHDGYMLLKADE